jgi:hypothetical protein
VQETEKYAASRLKAKGWKIAGEDFMVAIKLYSKETAANDAKMEGGRRGSDGCPPRQKVAVSERGVLQTEVGAALGFALLCKTRIASEGADG